MSETMWVHLYFSLFISVFLFFFFLPSFFLWLFSSLFNGTNLEEGNARINSREMKGSESFFFFPIPFISSDLFWYRYFLFFFFLLLMAVYSYIKRPIYSWLLFLLPTVIHDVFHFCLFFRTQNQRGIWLAEKKLKIIWKRNNLKRRPEAEARNKRGKIEERKKVRKA